MKRILCLTAFIACAFIYPFSDYAGAASKITVKATSYYAPNHPVSKSFAFFKETIERESKGRFQIQYYPNNQLGPEEAFIDQVKRGTIQMAVAGSMTKKDEIKLNLAEPPFIIETWRQGYAAYNGPIAQMIIGDYHKNTGTYIRGFVVNGFRAVSANSPVTSLEELRRLKLRVPGTNLFVNLFKALGCNPVMVPLNEVYNALETKVVDGQENPLPTVVASGFWEVQKYLLQSRHMFSANPVLVNGKFRDGLSGEDRELFDRCLQAAIDYNWKISQEADEEAIEFLRGKGLQLHVPSEEMRREMKNSLKGFYEWFYTEVPDSKEIIALMEQLPK